MARPTFSVLGTSKSTDNAKTYGVGDGDGVPGDVTITADQPVFIGVHSTQGTGGVSEVPVLDSLPSGVTNVDAAGDGYYATVEFDTGSPNHRLTVYRVTGAGTGTFTFTSSSNLGGLSAWIIEADDDATYEAVDTNSGSGGAASADLTDVTGNSVVAFCAINTQDTIVAGTNYTELGSRLLLGSPNMAHAAIEDTANEDATPAFTLGDTVDWGVIAIEFAEAASSPAEATADIDLPALEAGADVDVRNETTVDIDLPALTAAFSSGTEGQPTVTLETADNDSSNNSSYVTGSVTVPGRQSEAVLLVFIVNADAGAIEAVEPTSITPSSEPGPSTPSVSYTPLASYHWRKDATFGWTTSISMLRTDDGVAAVTDTLDIEFDTQVSGVSWWVLRVDLAEIDEIDTDHVFFNFGQDTSPALDVGAQPDGVQIVVHGATRAQRTWTPDSGWTEVAAVLYDDSPNRSSAVMKLTDATLDTTPSWAISGFAEHWGVVAIVLEQSLAPLPNVAEADVALPALVAELAAAIDVQGTPDVTLPALVAGFDATSGIVGGAAAELPALEADVTAAVTVYVVLDAYLPCMGAEFSADGSDEAEVVLNVELPALVGDFDAEGGVAGSVDVELPALFGSFQAFESTPIEETITDAMTVADSTVVVNQRVADPDEPIDTGFFGIGPSTGPGNRGVRGNR